MADDASWTTQQKKTIGDVAVDGLLAGMTAGLVMAGVLLVLRLLDGAGVAETLGRFDPGSNNSPIVGGLMHLAVAGLDGALFALAYHTLRRRLPVLGHYSWLAGAAYGLVLWLVAQSVLMRDLNAGLAVIAPWQFALAHLAFGIVLGYAIGRHAGE